MIKYLANILTLTRMFFSIILLLVAPLSLPFYLLYTLCIVTDLLDGFIARKTHTTSSLGALLDSLADCLFLLVLIIRIGKIIFSVLPPWGLWFVYFVVIIRCLSYLIGAIKFHKFTTLHTLLNKFTGFLLTLFPYCLLLENLEHAISSWQIIAYLFMLCLIASISAIEELLIILKSNKFNPNMPSLLKCIK